VALSHLQEGEWGPAKEKFLEILRLWPDGPSECHLHLLKSANVSKDDGVFEPPGDWAGCHTIDDDLLGWLLTKTRDLDEKDLEIEKAKNPHLSTSALLSQVSSQANAASNRDPFREPSSPARRLSRDSARASQAEQDPPSPLPDVQDS
jgi:hypothetical protein